MNTVAIIQARMGSSRFPGKVLMDIGGKPMLWHVVSRLRRSRSINDIIVATSLLSQDDPIEQFCRDNDCRFYRGSENDVLGRYHDAAVFSRADVVVRITADCPLIDPVVTDDVVSAYWEKKEEFSGASNVIRRTYPRGLDTEVVCFTALEEAWKKASQDHQREHVTAFIYEHPEMFKMYSVEYSSDLSSLRWTVDEQADLEFMREVYSRLYDPGDIFCFNDILRLLNKEPGLCGINKHIKQKTVTQ